MDAKNDFSKGSVAKNILNLALPMTLAQLINVLYNVVDRMYIGHIPKIGAAALTGVGVTFPIIMVISAFAALMAMGGAPKASIMMGKGDRETAEKILGNCTSGTIAAGLILTVLLLIFGRDLLMLFGASENTIGYADTYMKIYACGTRQTRQRVDRLFHRFFARRHEVRELVRDDDYPRHLLAAYLRAVAVVLVYVAEMELREILYPAAHLLDRPVEGADGFVRRKDYLVEHEMGQPFIVRELHKFGVDEDETHFVGRRAEYHAEYERVQEYALARARGACHQQMGEVLDVGGVDRAVDVLAHGAGGGGLCAVERGRLHQFPHADYAAALVRHLYADGVLPRDGREDADALLLHSHRDILRVG